jgi:CheY-like chemotaxis protein
LTPNTREALLLHTIERLSFGEIAEVMGITLHEAHLRVQTARDEMADAVRGRVLIIEDEAIIAMDLESLVSEAGHEVMGIARTRDGASALASTTRPDLILADIQLADQSSGIDAVNDLLGQYGAVPAIFITAFPERLLSGERPEPTFLIAKPFEEEEVRTAISQALFFASTETLATSA